MAKKFYETPEAKALIDKWNKKLEKNGFYDIDPGDGEQIKPERFTLPTHQSQYEHGMPGYYDLCHKILREYKFRTAVHKKIFEHHTEGAPEEKISELIKDEFGQTYTQQNINTFITRVKNEFIFGKKQ